MTGVRVGAAAREIGSEGEFGSRGVDLTDVGTDGAGSGEPEVGASSSSRASAKTVDVVVLLVMASGEAFGVTGAVVKLG